MIRVTFVCLGNICRSPMAELVFAKLVEDKGIADKFEVTSCATSNWEVGSPVYPPIAAVLRNHGVSGSHIARQITRSDVEKSDYILVMDNDNLESVRKLTAPKDFEKIRKVCSFTDKPRDVADPWYTRDFERTYRDILDGCESFLKYLEKKGL